MPRERHASRPEIFAVDDSMTTHAYLVEEKPRRTEHGRAPDNTPSSTRPYENHDEWMSPLAPAPRRRRTMDSGGRYRIQTPLGTGGAGEVINVRDQRLGRRIALKKLRPEHGGDEILRARFLREAKIQGQLEHPAIVPLYDIGESDGDPWFTMKRVRGLTLRKVLKGLRQGNTELSARFSQHKLLTAFSTVAQAMEYAHVHGVVHRDLKPGNIMLGDFGEVYVLDWGIAKVFCPQGPDSLSSLHGELPEGEEDAADMREVLETGTGTGTETDTQVGATLGTPGYMAPEQLVGDHEKIDKRCDIYALGAILFEILTLARLHSGRVEARMVSTLRGKNVQQSALNLNANLPPELVAICARATQLKAKDRFETPGELNAALQRYLEGDRDLILRKKLSRRHSQQAAELLVQIKEDGELADRKTALKSVGRALAFDPNNGDAMNTLVSMIDTPPSSLPNEVLERLEDDRTDTIGSIARSSAWSYLSLLLLVPLLVLMGVRSWYVVGTLIALSLAAAYASSRSRHKATARRVGLYPSIAISTVLIMFISPLLGPLIVVPGVAAINMAAYAIHVRGWRSYGLIAVGCATFCIPAALQWGGVLPASYIFTDSMVCLKPWAVGLPPVATSVFLLTAGVMLVVVGILLVDFFRRAMDSARHQIQLYAWHLQQLLPEEANDGTSAMEAASEE